MLAPMHSYALIWSNQPYPFLHLNPLLFSPCRKICLYFCTLLVVKKVSYIFEVNLLHAKGVVYLAIGLIKASAFGSFSCTCHSAGLLEQPIFLIMVTWIYYSLL